MTMGQRQSKRRRFTLGRVILLVAVVRNDVVPFVGGGSRDKRNHWLSVAHVKHFVGHARLDVNEITGFVFQDLFETASKLVPDFAFENVKDELEPDVNMRIGHAAGWDGSDVRR